MAVALTFVQPMLIGTQSSSSSIQILTNEEEDIERHVRVDGPISVRPSPSPSPSPSQSVSQLSPKSTMSPSRDSMIGIDCKLHSHITYTDGSTEFKFDTKDIEKTLCMDLKTDTNATDYVGHVHDCEEREIERSVSKSYSQCRYCYSDILRMSSVSQCHCSGVLCRECLIKELQLTHGRANGELQCTVCKNPYDVKTEFTFNMKRDCKSFCGQFLIHCGLKDEQYLLDSVGGKIGFLLVILGINTWILSTSLLFAFPPNGCPIELYYMVSVFDFAVGVSTIWFIYKCRYLSPLFLSVMYFLRFLYILFGWIPAINLCNIYVFHHKQSNHITILSYFLFFSFISSIIMCMCWIIDFKAQYIKYSKENGKLILTKNDIKIEIDNIVNNNNNHNNNNNNEADSF